MDPDVEPAASPRARVRPFHASQPTHVDVAAGLVDRVGARAASYGTRVLVVAGESHVRSSGVLDRLLASLSGEGLGVELLEGVGPNPSVAVVDAGAVLCRVRRIEVVVALGGGSVVDVAKAIATSAAAPEHATFATYLSGLRAPDLLVTAALPVVAVPTLPGSGSETNGTSVITDDDSGRKLSAHSDLAAPRVTLIDPELALDAPAELLAPGLADAWCHALEAALGVGATTASDALAEQAMRMLIRIGDAPLDVSLDRAVRAEALAAAWWATNLAGQALTLAGSLVTHPLAHPISARFDARHGASVAALEAAVVATFAEQLTGTGALAKVAGWFEVRGAAEDAAAAERGVLTRLHRYLATLGVADGVTSLGVVDDEHASVVVRDARASGSRGLRSVDGTEPSPDALLDTLDLARRCAPDASVRKLLAARDELRARRLAH